MNYLVTLPFAFFGTIPIASYFTICFAFEITYEVHCLIDFFLNTSSLYMQIRDKWEITSRMNRAMRKAASTSLDRSWHFNASSSRLRVGPTLRWYLLALRSSYHHCRSCTNLSKQKTIMSHTTYNLAANDGSSRALLIMPVSISAFCRVRNLCSTISCC